MWDFASLILQNYGLLGLSLLFALAVYFHSMREQGARRKDAQAREAASLAALIASTKAIEGFTVLIQERIRPRE